MEYTYYLEHKQIFSKFFKASDQMFSLICVQDGICKMLLAGKIQWGTPLKYLSKKLPGETLCNFFQIFPPKVLVYGGNIF